MLKAMRARAISGIWADLRWRKVSPTGREGISVILDGAAAVEDRQQTDEQSAIPVVGDAAAVVALHISEREREKERDKHIVRNQRTTARQEIDGMKVSYLARQVRQRIERQVVVIVEKHLHLPHADAQVALVELVWNVPAQRPKLAPLLDDGVEKAQREEQLLPPRRRLAALPPE